MAKQAKRMANQRCPYCNRGTNLDWCMYCCARIFRKSPSIREETILSQLCLKTGAAVFTMATVAFTVFRLLHVR